MILKDNIRSTNALTFPFYQKQLLGMLRISVPFLVVSRNDKHA